MHRSVNRNETFRQLIQNSFKKFKYSDKISNNILKNIEINNYIIENSTLYN